MGARTFATGLLSLTLAACAGVGGRGGDPFASPPVPGNGSGSADGTLRASGQVVSAPDGEALEDVRIVLLDRGDAEAASAVSDARGRFELGPVLQGTYTLDVSAEGYRGLRERIDFRGSPPARLTIGLPLVADDDAPEPAARLVTTRSYLEEMGFLHRQQSRSGLFLVRAEIRELNPSRTSDLIAGRQGFRLIEGVVMGRRGCPAGLYVDGMAVGDTRSLDRLVAPGSIEGLEAYPGDYLPPGMVPRGCGSVLIWTRRG